ncbi:MAG: sugar kinase [Candidatus Omnitrophota bacterium]|jgi:2-dehydro-3-deoxygluconokinase|nr:MAG: sugar kinase [Candidatus Omnitrophota bacterium]
MTDIVTFGEAMVRLAPPDFMRLEQTTSLDVKIGGGEYNVAVGAARLGLSSAFVSRLPQNPLGRMIANKAREHGVDTSHIVWTKDDRAGLYFVEFGAKPRASSVLYDRKDSAISKIKAEMVDWDAVFAGVKVYHVSGITPALSASAAEATKVSMQTAKKHNVTVSVDLNYRAKLWSEAEAQTCMTELMEYTDILITTEEDTMRVFKIGGENYSEVAKKLHERFGFKVTAITLRENPSVWFNTWSAIALFEGKIYDAPKYDVEIVDRVGGGDSFSAGFLMGYLTGDVDYAVKFGVAFSALKHSVPGDLNWCTREETEALMKGGGTLRIVR